MEKTQICFLKKRTLFIGLLAAIVLPAFILSGCPSESEDSEWEFETGVGGITVQFLGNGADVAAVPQRVVMNSGGTVDKPKSPEKTHYAFTNWYTDAVAGDVVTFPVTASNNTNFYARWSPNTYTATFNGNGGTPQSQPKNVTAPNLTLAIGNRPTEPTQVGFVFAGWFISSNPGAESFSLDSEITASMTIYAHWGKNLTVTFDGNGGTWDSAATRDVVVILPNGATDVAIGAENMPPTPQNQTKIFVGWYTNADYTLGEIFTDATPVSNDITVYARWGDLATNLELHYTFAENRADDMSGNGYNGTLVGTGNAITSKNFNGTPINYYRADSSGGAPALEIGSGFGQVIARLNTAFTIATYIFVPTGDWQDQAGRMIASFANSTDAGTAANGYMFLSAKTGTQGFAITRTHWAGEEPLTGSGIMTGAMWHHIAFTQTGKTGENNGKLYIDGVLHSKGTFTLLPADLGATAYNFIGRSPYVGDQPLAWSGVTDFRIYSRELSADEMEMLADKVDILGSTGP